MQKQRFSYMHSGENYDPLRVDWNIIYNNRQATLILSLKIAKLIKRLA